MNSNNFLSTLTHPVTEALLCNRPHSSPATHLQGLHTKGNERAEERRPHNKMDMKGERDIEQRGHFYWVNQRSLKVSHRVSPQKPSDNPSFQCSHSEPNGILITMNRKRKKGNTRTKCRNSPQVFKERNWTPRLNDLSQA